LAQVLIAQLKPGTSCFVVMTLRELLWLCMLSGAWFHCKAGDAKALRGSSREDNDSVEEALNLTCRTAAPNESCWDAIEWAMTIGLANHADWYPGLNASSRIEEFQCIVQRAHPDKCEMPCNVTCPEPEPLEEMGPSILHISDTHSMHRSTRLPSADILIHTGDVTEHGLDEEYRDFNHWLRRISPRYQHIFVIPGNHDWWTANSAHRVEATANAAAFVQQRITHATVLNHETAHAMGLKIWGAGWQPLSSDGVSGNLYNDIPVGIDVLVTHDPPHGIFDSTAAGHWGSSRELAAAIQRVKPKVHLFGHVHEQQGVWQKVNGQFMGGVTYHPDPSSSAIFKPNPPPSSEYAPELIINGAMANQATVDHSFTGRWQPMHLRGPYHLITASRRGDAWHFAVGGPRVLNSEGCGEHGCQARYQTNQNCQCNNRCAEFGNCCDDYDDMCASHHRPSPFTPSIR